MISVCMATYNGAKYINEQVDSILKQLSQNDELIISDDGSKDDTIEILKAYNDPRIKIFNNTVRKGVIGNFENALKNATGDYIFLSDQDDVWIEGKVKLCVEELQNVDLVMHDAIVWDGANVISSSFYKLRKTRNGYINNIVRNSYLGCCLCMRKSLLEYVLPIPDVYMHDVWIGLMACKKGSVSLINDKFLMYRRHGGNASTAAEKSSNSLLTMINNRMKIFWETIIR